jgi:hypothetical protein
VVFHSLQASPSSYHHFVGSYDGSNTPFIRHVLFVTRIPGSKMYPDERSCKAGGIWRVPESLLVWKFITVLNAELMRTSRKTSNDEPFVVHWLGPLATGTQQCHHLEWLPRW